MKYDKRWLYTLPCVSCVLLLKESLENRFSHVVSATGQTVNRYSDLSSVFGSAPCQSGRPRHSLHGKPAVFTAATSRFTAIMSQLSYHTRGNSKLQELFLYLSTNNFGKFHDSAVCELSCRTFLFYRVFANISTGGGGIARVRNDIPCLHSGYPRPWGEYHINSETIEMLGLQRIARENLSCRMKKRV